MQQDRNEDSPQEILLDIAKAEFEQCATHAAELDGKARTYLTFNALMMSAVVVALTKGGVPEGLPTWIRIGIGAVFVVFLLVLGNSYRHLLNVITVSSFRGVPKSDTTIRDYRERPKGELLASLTTYYSSRATSNSEVTKRIVTSLRNAVRYAKVGFALFFVLVLCLVANQFFPRNGSMKSELDESVVDDRGAAQSGTGDASGCTNSGGDGSGGTGSGGGDSGGGGAGGGGGNPPPPLQETIIEKGEPPPKVRGS